MKRALVAAAVALVVLVGCSNSVSEAPQKHGICEQVVRSKFLGVTYSTDRNHLNCDSQEGS